MIGMQPMGLNVFISYSHQDQDLRARLDVHLAPLKREGKINPWHDRTIEAGTEWATEIEQQLASAQIILLLISPDFMASDYCYDQEMHRAMQRHRAGTARVIPILLKPTDWEGSPFSGLQMLPRDAQPIASSPDRAAAFLSVVQEIRQLVETWPTAPDIEPPPEDLPVVAPTQPITPTRTRRREAAVYQQATWVERSQITPTLLDILRSSNRIFALTGMTGIGKTALMERLVADLADGKKGCRFNLDDGGLEPAFVSSGAGLLRSLGHEPTLADQQDPTQLLAHILELLRGHAYRVQIDSLERLLVGNEEEGWSEFADPLWQDLFQQMLAGPSCPSQLLLTTQDLPGELEAIGSAYPQFWYCQGLTGLSAAEQLELFRKAGVEDEGDYLQRIGTLYEGHPLILRVIATDIKACGGNVARYWQQCRFGDLEAQQPIKLSRRRLQREVKQRVKQSLERLPAEALQLLCRSAVYRRPVPESFWLAMLPDCPEEQQQAALSLLLSRGLAVEDWDPEQWLGADGAVPLRQHNLIRSVAYEYLKTNLSAWQRAELSAVDQWLTCYEPAADVPNLETIRGPLEAFHHYCEVKDWESAKTILLDQEMGLQLQIWGHYQEMIALHNRLTGCLSQANEVSVQKGIGNAYFLLSNYPQALNHWQQSLDLARELGDLPGQWKALNNLGAVYQDQGDYPKSIEYLEQTLNIAREIGDRQGEGNALGNLGLTYNELGEYQRAIDFHQQSLAIKREIGDRRGEGNVLGNLGIAYKELGEYQRAIDFHQQYLAIAREIGDRRGEGNALGNLGVAYDSLGEYQRAIDFHQQNLAIAREIGDRRGEGSALGNLGLAYNNLGEYQRAIDFYQQRLAIAREIGDRRGEAIALGNLGIPYENLGEYQRAIDFYQQYLAIAREIGDRRGEAIALGNLGITYCALANYSEALSLQQQKLEIAKQIGSKSIESYALSGLGEVQVKLEQFAQALENFQSALELCQSMGERSLEAEILKNIADLYHQTKQPDLARERCEAALALATELGIPLAEECRELLKQIEQQ